MEKCSRCHKRWAVVYITKIENGKSVSEGICLKCADELGIQPIRDVLTRMGVTGDALEALDFQIDPETGAVVPLDEEIGDDADTEGETASDVPEKNVQELDISKDKPFPLGRIFDMFGGAEAFGAQKGEGGSDDSGKRFKDGAQGKKRVGGDKYKYLGTYCKDLTESAKRGGLDAVIGRERELERVIQILSRRQKNNPCLIGEPGVGKTAIAEALASKLAREKVSQKLKKKSVFLVDLTALVAGTQFRGQFESRMQGLISDVKQHGNAILVIDEIHNIVGAGDADGAMNAANILKPALSRGEIQVIGATTMNEYRKYIEKDSALERRFQPVVVDEPSEADTVAILKGIKHYYEDYHYVTISDEIAERAVTLAERYITDRFLPDKAIDLIDEAAARVSLANKEMDRFQENKEALHKVSADIEALEEESISDKDVATSDDGQASAERYQKLAEMKTRQMQIKEELDTLRPIIMIRPEVTLDNLADVIEVWTGIPATSISENEFKRLDKLEDRIKSHIIGQDRAVSAVVRAIKRGRAGVISKRKPVSFIFAGPTGVGKTELVKTIAKDLFDTPDALIRVDMSEYMEKHAVSRIIGSPPGYVGFDDAGQLTEKIRRHPYSVLLFDEIEKAHPDVLNILLQILDDGKITDSHGRAVDFSNTIIVMTTNAGASVGAAKAGFGMDGISLEEDKTEKALLEFLRPEFVNRIDEIITFRALEKEDFASIAAIMLGELRDALKEKGISFGWTEDAAAHIADKAYSRKYGARNLRRFIQTEVEDKLASEIIARYSSRFTLAALSVSDGELKFDLA